MQKAQGTPNTINMKNTTARHIIIKLHKTMEKEKILKETKGKIKITVYFLLETM